MARGKQDSAALPLGPQELPELVETRRITDPKTLKVLADPLRIRILRVLEKGVYREPRIMTVKQIAAELDEPTTKLYRHVKQLLAVELIQVAEVRLVGGIVEQQYRVAQKSYGMDPRDLQSGVTDSQVVRFAGAAVEEFLTSYAIALDEGRTHMVDDESTKPPHVPSVGAIMTDLRLPQAKAAEFAERLKGLVNEFGAYDRDPEGGVAANFLTIYYATPAEDGDDTEAESEGSGESDS